MGAATSSTGSRRLLTGIALGAGVVYLLGPERRQRLRHRMESALATPRGLEASGGPSLRGPYGARQGDIAGLEAATLRSHQSSRPSLSPGLLGLVGGALTLFGLLRRGPVAVALRTIGAGLLTRGARQRAEPAAERRRAVDIQKTIHIAAPREQVYSFWCSYDNFPLFMSNVREIEDLGAGRSHWTVTGPGGAPIRWTAVLTEQVTNEMLAWRSEPGSMLENAGVVRFRPDGEGTRVELRFCYLPPIGGAGRAVAELLGADPRAKLNEDLGRLKSLLESTVRSDIHGQEPGS